MRHESKCQVLHITRAKCPVQTRYILHGTILESVPSAKYLGVTISGKHSWTSHTDSVSKKANQTLRFLKRNINVHNKDFKSTAYTTLVRPQLEYASTVWSPHTATDITKHEAVKRRSARWATRYYQRTSSVTQMMKGLNWRTLERRRIDSRLTLMYKITNDLVAIPAADYLIPNTRQSRHNHQLAYRQIPTLKDLQVHILSPHHSPLERPPILHPCFAYCGTIQSCCVPSSTLSVDIRSAFTF